MIERNQLSNGVRVITEHIPHVRSVAIGIWVKMGSRFETLYTNGMSHFIEHMVFKGTATRSARDIAEAFDEIGGQVNAFTSKEYTCFYAKVLDEHASIALEVLHDMFFHSTFDPVEVEKEKQVIIEEIRMVEDTPDDWVHDLASQALLPDHPLGYSILGSEDNVRSFKSEDLQQFVNNRYTPERTVITAVGNIPHDLHEHLAQLFGQFQRLDNRGQDSRIPVQFKSGIEQRIKPTEQAHLCLSFPALSIRDPRIYALILLNGIVGGNMSSRLFQEIREERGLAYSVFSYQTAFEDCGSFTIYAGTGSDQVEHVCELILNILRDLCDHGVSPQEVRKAKEQTKGGFTLGMELTTNRMSRLGKNELMLGKHPSVDEVIGNIDHVRIQDVNELAQQLFAAEFSVSIISPHDQLPAAIRRDALVSHSNSAPARK